LEKNKTLSVKKKTSQKKALEGEPVKLGETAWLLRGFPDTKVVWGGMFIGEGGGPGRRGGVITSGENWGGKTKRTLTRIGRGG